jgi:hypothetical protein
MRSALLRTWLTALLVLTGMPLVAAEPSSPPQLQEEVWGLPFELPTLAYVVHRVGSGPFPLVVMNHGVSLNAKERSFFPLVEFRDAAFWFARQGYMVVAPVPRDMAAEVSTSRSVGSLGPSTRTSGRATNPISAAPGSPSRRWIAGSSIT